MRNWSLGSWAYEWNANGSLKKVKCPDGKEVTFAYDALGRRTKKVANGKIKRYLWDGNVLLHEWEYNAADEPQLLVSPIGEVTFDKEEPIENLTTWVYENGSFVPIGKLTENERFSIVSDYIGRPVLAFDENGEKVWSAEYDIYGKLINLQGDKAFIPFRQLGQYEDVETELYYNRFRYYDPNSGLYISQDPIGLAGGLSFYAYVRDVNKFVDVFGLIELFRAVFEAEYKDITENNVIRNKGGQYELGKLFATNHKDAFTFGTLLQKFETTEFKIISVEAPDDLDLFRFRADGMEAVSVNNEDLEKLKIKCV
ncbi:RHS repeat-associated core domain-containing protein [Capnocytophaga canis]|uniref:RHS repeat-associated core domain-containing protein n=1 Tax=Capnocytophaga canis TaxID=1848903 RepID=UPI001562AEAA